MGSFAKNDYVMSHDDDLLITKADALEGLVNEYIEKGRKGMAIGPYGVILGKNNLYFPKNILAKGLQKIGSIGIPKHLRFPKKNVRVDVIKGRMIFLKKADLNNIPILPQGLDSFVSKPRISQLCIRTLQRYKLLILKIFLFRTLSHPVTLVKEAIDFPANPSIGCCVILLTFC